jgi:hypothetical protein
MATELLALPTNPMSPWSGTKWARRARAAGVIALWPPGDVVGLETKPDGRRRVALVEVAPNRVTSHGVQIVETAALGEDRRSQRSRDEASLRHSFDEECDFGTSGAASSRAHRIVRIARSGWDPTRPLGRPCDAARAGAGGNARSAAANRILIY